MTIKKAQLEVDQWIKKYGVRYFSELTNMVLLSEEVGELARIIARTYGVQSFKEGEEDRSLGNEWIIALAKASHTKLWGEAYLSRLQQVMALLVAPPQMSPQLGGGAAIEVCHNATYTPIFQRDTALC